MSVGKLTISAPVIYRWEGSEHHKLVPIETFDQVTENQARELMRDFKGENSPHNHGFRGLWKPYPVFM